MTRCNFGGPCLDQPASSEDRPNACADAYSIRPNSMGAMPALVVGMPCEKEPINMPT